MRSTLDWLRLLLLARSLPSFYARPLGFSDYALHLLTHNLTLAKEIVNRNRPARRILGAEDTLDRCARFGKRSADFPAGAVANVVDNDAREQRATF
jgi:hypothetical protein